jgi:hypothetical protein
MNVGTKIRTALRVAVSLNTAVYAVTAAIGQLGWGWLTVAWAVLTIISDFAVAFLTTYYNNDYTEIAARHTAEMRQEKAELKDGYIGDRFFTEAPEEEVEDEHEDIPTV